jgi:hypothetical protein
MDAEEFRPYRGNVYRTKQLNSEGQIADKFDYVVFDIDAVDADLKAYQKAAAKNFIDEEQNLVDNVFTYIESAKADRKLKRNEESQEQMAEGQEIILDSDLLVAPDLLKIFTSNISSNPGELRYRDVTVEESLERDNYREADNIDYRDGDFESSIYYGDEGFEAEGSRMYGYGTTTMINNRSRVYKGGAWNDRSYWLSPGTRRFLDEDKASAAIGFRCAMDRMGSQVLAGPR